jgi:RNA recognition motif. (a.k.a. RRM, RBD, or RNP domain)
MRQRLMLMEENDLIQPELNSDLTSFTVTLFNQSVFNNQQQAWLKMFEEYNLSRNQQRIVVAGMNGRELSPSDIERAMNTQDLNTYNIEVTFLRNTEILELTRSQSTRSALAKRKDQSKKDIPCFKVKDPRQKIRKIKDSDALKKIAVLGLPLDVMEQDLVDFFGAFGDVEEIEIPVSGDILQTKFAFVTFSNPATTLELLSCNQLLVMRDYPLTIKLYR